MATTNGINKELAQKIQNPNAVLGRGELKIVLANFQGEIERALPTHLKKNSEKYARQLFSLITLNPKLQTCRLETLLSSLMTASSLGLDLTPQLGQCYIIPYDNRKRDGKAFVTVTEAQFQLGYRGAIALAQRSGEVTRIQADAVRRKDRFKYSKGLNPILEHEESAEEDRGEITHVYAVANYKNGGYAFEVWPVGKVTAHAKKTSKSYYKDEYKNDRKTGNKIVNEKSPWHTDFESMAKKTLIMAIWKYLPLSTELMLADTVDGTIKDDISQVQNEHDVITLTPKSIGDDDDEYEEPKALVESNTQPEPRQNLAPVDENMIPPGDVPVEPKESPKPATCGFEGDRLRSRLEELMDGMTAEEKEAWCMSNFKKALKDLTIDDLEAAVAKRIAEIDAREM